MQPGRYRICSSMGYHAGGSFSVLPSRRSWRLSRAAGLKAAHLSRDLRAPVCVSPSASVTTLFVSDVDLPMTDWLHFAAQHKYLNNKLAHPDDRLAAEI